MKKAIYLLMAAAALCACSKVQETQEAVYADGEIRFNMSIPQTKATATGFESGDAVSLYAVEYEGAQAMPLQLGGNFFNNEKLTFDGAKWNGVRPLFWSAKPCDFYALYPAVQKFVSVEEQPFTVATDQNGPGYEASDLLFAKAENVSRSAAGVNLQFKHILSKVVVKIVKGTKFEGAIPDDIVAHIYDTNVDCFIDMTSGSVAKSPLGARKTITMKKISNELFEAVLVPQNIETSTPLIELTMGGIAYLLDHAISFRAGYVHTILLTVNTSPDQEKIDISIDAGMGQM